MSETPIQDLSKLIDSVKADISNGIIPKIRELQAQQQANYQATQALIVDQLRDLLKATNKIETATAHLFMAKVEEIDGNGTGVIGRRKRSTALDTGDEAPSGRAAPEPKKKEKAVRELSGELVVPGSGKRGCGKCHRTGHRAQNCPN